MPIRSRRSLLLTTLCFAIAGISRVAYADDPIAELHAACEKGDTEAVKRLLAADPKLVDQRESGGITPLGRAVVYNKTEVVKILLEAGADPNLAKPDGASPLHDAVTQKNSAILRLLLEHKANTEVRWQDGSTPLLGAVYGTVEIVRLLLDAGAKRDARTNDGRTPALIAVFLLAGGDSNASREGAKAFLESVPVSVQVMATPLREVLTQILAPTGIPVDVDTGLTTPITATLKIGLDSALSLILRMARTAGQPIAVTIAEGRLKIGASSAVVAPIATEAWPVLTTDPRYRFDRTISRAVLNAYLSHAVTHFGLLASSPEPATPYFDDDLRMLKDIGAKFIGRCAYSWEPPDDDEAHFRLATERAGRVHAAAPEMLLQAAVFETAYRKMERIPVPDWVFMEFGLPTEKRTFRYEATLYDGGKLRDHWMHDASVPDMSKIEARMWFYYRARRYIDAGCEAIHFGQVHLMDHNDPSHRHWLDLLTRIRRYALKNARRRFVLCDAHTHGITISGNLLFDLHSFPLIVKDIPERPRQVELVTPYYNTIYGRSLGGVTPSGWRCDHLPYLAEIDNGGTSDKPWQPIGFPWVWGVDTISWFAHQEPKERDEFLQYAWDWLVRRREDGWFQPATRRVLAAPVNGVNQYHANRKSDACPIGFGQEDAIKALWKRV